MRNRLDGLPYKWVALSVVAIGTFMATLDAGAVRVVLPALSGTFGVSADVVLWVWLIYLLVSTGLMLTLGQAGDTLGRKRLYTMGLAVFTVGLTLCSAAASLPQLLFFRSIQAVGAAMTVAMGNAIVTASFPAQERGKALGVMGAVVSAGLLAGPAFGGVAVDWLGWNSVFYLRIPVGVLAIALCWPLLRSDAAPLRFPHLDLRGASLLFTGLACLLVAVNRGQHLGWQSPVVAGLATVALLLLGVFVRTEQRVPHPVIDLSLFRDRLFTSASTSHVLLYVAITGPNLVLPFYLIDALEVQAARAGLLLAILPAMRVVMSPPAGKLSDRIGTLVPCTVGLAILCAGLVLLWHVDLSTPLIEIVGCLVVLGIGMGLFVPPNTSAIMGSVRQHHLGRASALLATSRQVGMSLGLAVGGTLFTLGKLSYANGLAGSTLSGFRYAIAGAIALAVLTLIASAVRGRKQPNPESHPFYETRHSP
ncbi:MAG: DHA2 family efflux MFS transporter permease subunit [Chloroflexota bacterium]